MVRSTLAILLAATMAGCGAPSGSEPPTSTIIANDTFAMVYEPTASRAEAERQAREICGTRQWCKVMGWSDRGLAAKALPMTDRELAGQKFVLTINRTTGIDEATWS